MHAGGCSKSIADPPPSSIGVMGCYAHKRDPRARGAWGTSLLHCCAYSNARGRGIRVWLCREKHPKFPTESCPLLVLRVATRASTYGFHDRWLRAHTDRVVRAPDPHALLIVRIATHLRWIISLRHHIESPESNRSHSLPPFVWSLTLVFPSFLLSFSSVVSAAAMEMRKTTIWIRESMGSNNQSEFVRTWDRAIWICENIWDQAVWTCEKMRSSHQNLL